MDVKGKVVWITGASSGIGAGLAVAMSKQGARLMLSARREEKLAAVRAACVDPEAHLILPLDLAATETLPAAAEQALGFAGHIDILVNNGGVSHRSRVEETTDLTIERQVMEVNYFGAVALTKAVLPSMLERGSGHVVVVSSVMGKFSTPLRSAYAASKHALHGFFDALRAEVWDAGIRVTIICPGYIRTEISYHALTADGGTHGKLDPGQAKGMSPEKCAAGIIRAIEKEKAEVRIGGPETLVVHLKRFMPGLLNTVIRKVKVT